MCIGAAEYINVVVLCVYDGHYVVWQHCCIEVLYLLAGVQKSEELWRDGVQRSIKTMKESEWPK